MKKRNLRTVIAIFSAMILMASVSPIFVYADGSSVLAPNPNSFIKMDEFYDDYPNVIFDRGNPGGFNIPITTNNASVTVRPAIYKDIFSYSYSPQKNFNYALGYGNYPLHLSQSFSVSVWFKAVMNTSSAQVLAADCPYSVSPRWKIYIGTDCKVHFYWANGSSNIDLVINRTDYFNAWRQVTFTFDGTNLRAYMDGTVNNAAFIPESARFSAYFNDRMMVGNDINQVSPFQGYITGIKLYDGVTLTDEQILSEVLSITPEIPVSDPIPQTNLRLSENPADNPNAFLDRGLPGGYNIPITTNDASVNVRPSYPNEVFPFAYSPQKNYNYSLGFGDYAMHLYKNFSVSFTIKAVQNSTAAQVVAADCPYSVSPRWKISIGTDNKVHFAWGTSGMDLAIEKTDYFNKWTQVIFSYDGTTLSAYMDGILENSAVIPDELKFSAYANDRLMVGNDINQISPFKGGIAELQFFEDTSLSAGQAEFKYNLLEEAVNLKDAQNRAGTGDINKNGALDVLDLVEIRNILLNKTEIDSLLIIISDYNHDKKIGITDILKFKALLTESPAV